MKIFIVYHYNGLGGGVRSGIDIALALSEMHEVKILIQNPSPELKQVIDDIGKDIYKEGLSVPCFSYYNGGPSFLRALITYMFSRKSFDQWYDLVKAERPDILISNSIVQWPLFSFFQKKGLTTVCFVRETMKGKWFSPINLFLRTKLEHTQGVAFLTLFDLKSWRLKEEFREKCVVVPHMVDKEVVKNGTFDYKSFRAKQGIIEDDFVVLYLGGFSRAKGIEQLIDTARFLVGTQIRILILGNCDFPKYANNFKMVALLKYFKNMIYVNSILRKIHKINLRDQIIIVKGMQKEIQEWYKISDVVVFPVQKVHQARPIYEAGINKKTIIVPDYPNFKENLISNYNGLFYERKSCRDLSNKIFGLYQNRDFCKVLGENNFKMTIEKHEKNDISTKVNTFINNVVHNDSKSKR